MIYEIHVDHVKSDAPYKGFKFSIFIVETNDSIKDIQQFLIGRGLSKSDFQIFKRKALTINKFKNSINKDIKNYKE